MTEPERQDPGVPPSGEPSGTPVPPSAPYAQPPFPGDAPAATPAAYPAPAPHPVGEAFPAQPQQPYGQPGPHAAPPAGQPCPPPPPYGGQQQMPYGYGQQPPYPPYPGQPAYSAAPEQPKKRKAWPWVLGGCLIVLLLGIGGCASCAAFFAFTDSEFGHGRYYDRYDDRYNERRDDRYDDRYDRGYGSNSEGIGSFGIVTLGDIKEAGAALPSKVEDGRCSPGVYTVGAGKDIEPDLYFLEGSRSVESSFFVFDDEDGVDRYRLDDSVVYFGNYFTNLEAGDVIMFEGAEDARMYPAPLADFKPQAPYQSGLYRVGTDIPAGSYTVTVDEAPQAAKQEYAAFVMKDLEFDDDSITEAKYVAHGGSQTVTVKDGDWLELYGTVAAPA